MSILNDYLSSISPEETPSILLSHDFESDDSAALIVLFESLKKITQDRHIQLCFLVGEGHSGKKVARMQKTIELAQKQGYLDNCDITVIQGFDSDKNFRLDGVELFGSIEAVETALSDNNLAYRQTEAGKYLTINHLSTYLKHSPKTLILGTKPPREFLVMHELGLGERLGETTYAGTFSFNIRTILWELENNLTEKGMPKAEAKAEAHSQVLNFLENTFNQVIYFESFFTAGPRNSYNENSHPDLFNLLKHSSNPLLQAELKLIDNWNDHVLGKDVKTIFSYTKPGVTKDQVRGIVLSQWSQDKESSLYNLIDPEKLVTDSERENLKRKLKKWKNITQYGRQFILADPAFMVYAVTGMHLQICPSHLCFNSAGYSTFLKRHDSRHEHCTVYAVIPERVTIDEYIDYLDLLQKSRNLGNKIWDGEKRGEDVSVFKDQLAVIKLKLKSFDFIPHQQQDFYAHAADIIRQSMQSMDAKTQLRVSEASTTLFEQPRLTNKDKAHEADQHTPSH